MEIISIDKARIRLRCIYRSRRAACSVRSQHAAEHFGTGRPSAANAQPLPPQSPQSSPSLRVSQRIAAARAIESRRCGADDGGPPLFLDPYGELLASWRQQQGHHHQDSGPDQDSDQHLRRPGGADAVAVLRQTTLDVIATAHIDRLLLNAVAVSAVNRITKGDYRQVVLLGDGMDTRPYRLPLEPGTAIFIVAPAAAHAAAVGALMSEAAAAIADAFSATPTLASATTTSATTTAAIAPVAAAAAATVQASSSPGGGGPQVQGLEQGQGPSSAAAADGPSGREPRRSLRPRPRGPQPPPGSLLRRVPLEIQPGADFSSLGPSLEAAGFRADRLSVWAVQGLAGLGLRYQDVVSLLAEAAHCAAYHSLLLGELPCMSYNQAANALADCGLLGAPLAFGTPDSNYGRWRSEWSSGSGDGDADADGGGNGDAEGGSGGGGGGGGPRDTCATDPYVTPTGAATTMNSVTGTFHGAGVGMGPRAGAGTGAGADGAPQRWLFAAQQIRLSAAQMDTYAAHRAAAEDADEDFFDNFS